MKMNKMTKGTNKKDLFPLIMNPPIFVDDLIAQATEDMVFGETKDIRKWGKERKEKYEIQKQAEQIRNYYTPHIR